MYTYFDTNSLIRLWARHLKMNEVGTLQLPSGSLFQDGIISESNIDELIHFEGKNGALKNAAISNTHMCITLLENIDIIQPIVKLLNKPEINLISPPISALLSNKDQIKGYLMTYVSGLASGEHDSIVKKNLTDKEAVILDSKNTTILQNNLARKTVSNFVDEFMSDKKIPLSIKDFFLLCKYLSAAKREKKISVPVGFKSKNFYKSGHHYSENIDFFHISYAPLVANFVTNDLVVSYFLTELKKKKLISCDIFTSNTYFSYWFKKRITDG